MRFVMKKLRFLFIAAALTLGACAGRFTSHELEYAQWLGLPTDGPVFLAHNVVNKRSDMGDFLDAIAAAPGAWSSIIAPSGEGISLTYKHR